VLMCHLVVWKCCVELNLVGSWCQFYFLVALNKSWSFKFLLHILISEVNSIAERKFLSVSELES
jgi:hypothetical protein